MKSSDGKTENPKTVIAIVIYLVPSSLAIFIAAAVGLFLVVYRRRKKKHDRIFRVIARRTSSNLDKETPANYSPLKAKDRKFKFGICLIFSS